MAKISTLPAAGGLTGSVDLVANKNGQTVRLPVDDVLAPAKEVRRDIDIGGAELKTVSSGVVEVHPLAVGRQGQVLVGVREADGSLVATLSPDDPSLGKLIDVRVVQPAGGLQALIGTADVLPIAVGRNGGIALGFDSVAGELVGAWPQSLAAGGAAAPRYLDDDDRATPLLGGGWNGLIFYGQSLSEGLGASVVSNAQPYANLTFGSGPRSGKPGNTANAVNVTPGTTTTAPLTEVHGTGASGFVGGETGCTESASFLNVLAAERNGVKPSDLVTFASSAGHGSYGLSILEPGGQSPPGSGFIWYEVFKDHVAQAAARAADASKPYQLDAVVYIQGEAESQPQTPTANLFAYYRDGLIALRAAMQADVQALTGQTTPVHLLLFQTPSNGNGGVDLRNLNAIQAAQLAAAEADPRIHLMGPIFHLFGDAADGVHPGGRGQKLMARYAGRARYALLIEGVEPARIRLKTAVAHGTRLTLNFDVPRAPLVLDPNLAGAVTDHGFRVVDSTGVLTLSNIAARGSTVTLTLNRTLDVGAVVRIGMDYVPTAPVLRYGGAHNLRDSTKDAYRIGLESYDLPHVCPHLEAPIIILEDI